MLAKYSQFKIRLCSTWILFLSMFSKEFDPGTQGAFSRDWNCHRTPSLARSHKSHVRYCVRSSANLIWKVNLYLYPTGYSHPHHVIILVATVLWSLWWTLIFSILRNRGISVAQASLNNIDGDKHDLLKEAYAFLFGSPEAFIQNEKWKNVLRYNV